MHKIAALTALRFFAALSIVLHHLRGSFGINVNAFQGWNFGVAVSLFFVLSGFVLQYSYGHISRQSEIRSFYFKRVFRIWPLHLICAVLAILLIPNLLENSVRGVLILTSNLFLVQGWVPIPEYYFSINPVSWSISVEVFFYLLFPALTVALRRQGVLILLFVTFIITILIISAGGKFPNYSVDAANEITSHGLIYINPITRLFEFVLGMSTASVYKKVQFIPNSMLASIFEIVILSTAVLWVSPLGRMFDQMLNIQNHGLAMYWGYTGAGLIWCAVIFILAFNKGFISRILQNKIFVFLGEISFALYMIHYPISNILTAKLTVNEFAPSIPLVTYFTVCLSLSTILFLIIERPCVRLGNKILKQRLL
jgi:peptidoglycan/LPS O-acetylase OafA/YrhL